MFSIQFMPAPPIQGIPSHKTSRVLSTQQHDSALLIRLRLADEHDIQIMSPSALDLVRVSQGETVIPFQYCTFIHFSQSNTSNNITGNSDSTNIASAHCECSCKGVLVLATDKKLASRMSKQFEQRLVCACVTQLRMTI